MKICVVGAAAIGGLLASHDRKRDPHLREKVPNHFTTKSEDQGPRLTQPVRITEQAWSEGTIPIVSICSTAYNHENFIRECIEGFLMQETTFPVEILIHDDASTDSTANIVREYEAQYPHIIKPIYQKENQYSKGVPPFGICLYPCAKGKYIALCEGDDYWTAPNKLQTQVDFMESHPDYSGCFHNVNVVYEDGSKSMHPAYTKPLKDTFTVQDLAPVNFIHTPSNLFRARLFPEFPAWYARMPLGDWSLHVLNAEHGAIGYIDRIFAVYRVHGGGAWSSLSESEIYRKSIQVAEAIDAHLGFKYTKAIKKNIAYWHYRIALNMSKEGIDKRIFAHLKASIRNCFSHEQISKKAILAMFIKHSCPVLYMRLKQIKDALRSIRS
jgi:glycosyltransferase involved in cell wall biosynthesis